MIVACSTRKAASARPRSPPTSPGELALRGQHVVLLDADPQGSALDWTQRRSQQGLPRLFSAVGLARETLHQEAQNSPGGPITSSSTATQDCRLGALCAAGGRTAC
jgi:hypothetical protein